MRQQTLPSAHVISVEQIEDGSVSVMQTSTGTFIANGLLSHNCEALKHLKRSYVEQPSVEGIAQARFDRRDYMTRWGEILSDEQPELDKMLDQFKMAFMGLGSVQALVAGGVYVQFAPTRVVGSMAARPYYWRMWH